MAHSTLPKLAIFLSTPSARRATDFYYPVFANLGISIHALREEGDTNSLIRSTAAINFYPRPPRGGRLLWDSLARKPLNDFYPRPPRGGRPAGWSSGCTGQSISIHALREEGDLHGHEQRVGVVISIHALREEGDALADEQIAAINEFLSTPSARRATCGDDALLGELLFLSTPSARRATSVLGTIVGWVSFLSTPSARRATAGAVRAVEALEQFLSTPSARRATRATRRRCP